jgi:hypothetical protein
MAEPVTNSRPVFIVGMNGSGTTMMLDCLNAHREVYGFPRETRIIPYYAANLRKYGDLGETDKFKALWDDFRGVSCFRWVNGGSEPELPDDWRERAHSLTTVIDETFSYFARKQGKSRWCEKTPMHAQHIAALHDLFPEACFIHMIRDGRACAASFHRRWRYVPQRTIYRWKNVIRAARKQASDCGANYLEVFYEQLTRDPASEMHKVCEFIGVQFEEAVLSPSRKPGHTGSTADTIVQSAPRWHTYFDDRHIRALEGIGGRTLAELGYATTQPDGDRDPRALELRSWEWRDYARRGISAVWEELTTPRKKKWDNLGGRISSAIRQRFSSRF